MHGDACIGIVEDLIRNGNLQLIARTRFYCWTGKLTWDIVSTSRATKLPTGKLYLPLMKYTYLRTPSGRCCCRVMSQLSFSLRGRREL